MISVLIPVYNYEIVNLVREIHTQLISAGISFEIITLEDGSTSENISKNQVINSLSNTTLLVSGTNIGRVAARQKLSEEATYDWLLFLDADVMPKSKTFIKTYIDLLSSNYDTLYGGFAYKATQPDPNYMLRWVYGKTKEEIPAVIRNHKPYKIIISANFMIKKITFNHINSQINHAGYGMDNIFGALLKSNGVKVFHVDNEVYHLGIEKSDVYIAKKQKAAEILLQFGKERRINTHQNDLLSLFTKLKHLRLNYLLAMFYKIFNNKLKQNLMSKNPSIKILQLFRITYMCYSDLNSKTIK